MVTPRSGQTVYYIIESGESRPMMVVTPKHEYIEGYVFYRPEDGKIDCGPTWTRATYAGRTYPREGNFVPGKWFYAFPEL